MKKRIVAMVLAAMTVVAGLAGCAKTNKGGDTSTDSGYVINKGKLVVGITDFEPMDYKNENGDWIGFDADLAAAFAKSLGVDVEFVEIDWDNKTMELDGKSVDCIWNGMTLNDEVLAAMDCSNAYCNNAQVIIAPVADKDSYQDVASLGDFTFAVEAGSAGQKAAEANGLKFTPVQNQAAALMEVKANTCNGAIIDALMAAAMVGEGTSYENLTYTIGLTEEKYGVGFRMGSDLVGKLNDFFKSAYADGTIESLAKTYGITASILPQ